MNDEFNELLVQAHKRSFKRAFETAVRTRTYLVFDRNGKIVKVKPPFKYVMVSTKKKIK